MNISPEEVDRLRPSAPQNDRRRRIARIRPDSETHRYIALRNKGYIVYNYYIQSVSGTSLIRIDIWKKGQLYNQNTFGVPKVAFVYIF